MLKIRPIASKDAESWSALWQRYLEFYETTLPPEIYQTTFARLTDPSVTDFAGLIAEKDGMPIGLTHYITHRHGWRLEDVVYLQDLYVSPETRGTGAGKALIEAVYNAADAAGTPSVYWLTQADNVKARRLYDHVADVTSFIKYQRRPQS